MQARRKDLVAQICLPDVLLASSLSKPGWSGYTAATVCVGDRVSVKALGFGDAADVGLDPLPV